MPQARLPVSLYLAAPGSRFWTSSTPLTLEDALSRAASLGYDAIEIMPRDGQAHLAACVRECGLRAGELGMVLTVEPGNRYETGFVHTVDEGVALLEAVDVPSVLLQLDTFHMNIEEASIAGAVRRAGPRLAHVHLADSNRRAPGWGHLDFGPVVGALRAVGYAGAIGLEILFTPDFEAAAGQGVRFVRQLFTR